MPNIADELKLGSLAYTLEEGTSKLRQFVQESIISGDITDEQRIADYELYMQFYSGNHWKMNNKLMLSFNYCRAFVDKPAQFLLGKSGFSLKVSNLDNSPVPTDIEQQTERLLMREWNLNKRLVKTYEMLQMGGVTGDLWVQVSWDVAKKHSAIQILDSRHCFPEFKENAQQVSAFTIRQPMPKNNPAKYVIKVTNYTPQEITTWFQKTTSKTPPDKDKFEVVKSENPFGFIPIVHIKNKPTSFQYFSYSDIQDLIKLNKTYNELIIEVKSIIDYHINPVTVVTGATVRGLTKKLGSIWSGLPPEANVFNLGLDSDMSAGHELLRTIKTAMHELGDIPENYLGKIQAISNTSAAAIALTYQPLIQIADQKWMLYGEGIAEINRLILRILELNKQALSPQYVEILNRLSDYSTKLGGAPTLYEGFQVYPVFKYGFPQDSATELQNANMEITLGLNSKRSIMERLGFDNVPALLKEIDDEKLKEAALQKRVQDIADPVSAAAGLMQLRQFQQAQQPQQPQVSVPTLSAQDVLAASEQQ